MVRASFVKSMGLRVLSSIGAWELKESSWGVRRREPFSSLRRVVSRVSAPIWDKRVYSSSAVSFSPIGVRVCSSMSPVSTPSAIIIVVTPVSVSPFKTAHWIGPAPRYLGRREAWTLMQPYFGRSSTRLGRIFP